MRFSASSSRISQCRTSGRTMTPTLSAPTSHSTARASPNGSGAWSPKAWHQRGKKAE
jgi:hypothetical protein